MYFKAGTDFGYGDLGWAVFSTLAYKEENVLRLKARTPNSLTLTWPASWLPVPNEPYTVRFLKSLTCFKSISVVENGMVYKLWVRPYVIISMIQIRARTLHSVDGHEREVSISNHNEGSLNPEYTLRNLEPGSTFNVTLSTALEVYLKLFKINSTDLNKTTFKAAESRGVFYLKNPTAPPNRKSSWAVFSTLRQGMSRHWKGKQFSTLVSLIFINLLLLTLCPLI